MFLVVVSCNFDRVIIFYCFYLNKTFDHIVCSLKGADFVVIQKVIAISLKRATKINNVSLNIQCGCPSRYCALRDPKCPVHVEKLWTRTRNKWGIKIA